MIKILNKTVLILLLFSISLFGEHRVVTLSPSINEVVYALGVGDKVVANTQYCTYPEETKNVPKIGGYATVSLEKILKAKPTVVLGQNYDQKLLNNLKSLGIKTLVFKTTTLDDIKNSIEVLGDYFDKKEKAKQLIQSINNSLLNIDNIVENKKILLVVGPRKTLSNQIYITGNHVYFEDVIKASGNKNAYFSKSKMQPVVNTEKIINMNPDIIVLLSPYLGGKDKEQKDLLALWQTLPVNASQNKDIYIIDKEYAGIPSNRVVYFIKDFKKILEDVRSK